MGDPFGIQTVSDPIPCPFDAGTWIRVRRLSGLELDNAARANQIDVESGSPRAWPRRLRRALEKGAADPEVLTAIRDPLLGYDRYELSAAGLVAWNVPLPLDAVIDAAAKWSDTKQREAHYAVRLATVKRLSDEEVEWTAREVLKRTKPALFLTTEEDVERAQKELPAAASVA